MIDKVYVVIGQPYNEDVISCAVFRNKEDAENYIIATTHQERYISIDVQDLIIHDKFPMED